MLLEFVAGNSILNLIASGTARYLALLHRLQPKSIPMNSSFIYNDS
jgi:hypothetical protein